ncbi:MAG: hypothetical protein RR576_10645 [Oscillospiraceae bacterium]
MQSNCKTPTGGAEPPPLRRLWNAVRVQNAITLQKTYGVGQSAAACECRAAALQ